METLPSIPPVKRLILSSLLAASLPLLPTPASACDLTSYFQAEDGRCMDLTALTWLGMAQDKQSAIIDEAIPYEFKLIELNPAAIPGGTVTGRIELRNISEFTTIKTSLAAIIAPNGSTWSPFIERDLAPGQTHQENLFFTANIGSLTVGSGEFKSLYNPDYKRDQGGIANLFDQRDSAIQNAWPYPTNELTFCLTDSSCPGAMWRSHQSTLATAKSPSPTASSPATSSNTSGNCNVASDIAADGKRCGDRAASEKPGGR